MEAFTDTETFTQYRDRESRDRSPFQLPIGRRVTIDAEQVFGKHYKLKCEQLHLVGHRIERLSPMAWPLLKDNTTN